MAQDFNKGYFLKVNIIKGSLKLMLKLFDLSGKNGLRFSPPCWNVKLCLILNNIDFLTIPVRFTDKEKIAFSKQKLVPILDHKEGFVSDSWNIINWLNENYPEKKIFINNSSKNFSYYLYLWTSRQLLPILFKIIAHEIPNVLDGNDLDYYIKSREKRINGPITKFVPKISSSIEEFRKSIDPIRKIIINNGYISGNKPGIEDCIFFGNLKWVDLCSSCNLLDFEDPINKWYKNLLDIANQQIN